MGEQLLGHRGVALVIGILSAPGVPLPVDAGDVAGRIDDEGRAVVAEGIVVRQRKVSTPVPVSSETSATFFGLVIIVTGSKRAMASATSP